MTSPAPGDDLREILAAVASGELDEAAAEHRIRTAGFVDLGFAKLDRLRSGRQGFPEVVFCEGKTPDQAAEIIARLADMERSVLATRADAEVYDCVRLRVEGVEYHSRARVMRIEPDPQPRRGRVLVISAGTSDEPVAEEAALTADLIGARVKRIYDAGVAGIHRLLAHVEAVRDANAVVVVAGMEGALPSVVGGLTDRPVIAVPTSVGYGSHLEGLAPLLAMLNTCVPGVMVVNIDNGFGAGYAAAMINRRCPPGPEDAPEDSPEDAPGGASGRGDRDSP